MPKVRRSPSGKVIGIGLAEGTVTGQVPVWDNKVKDYIPTLPDDGIKFGPVAVVNGGGPQLVKSIPLADLQTGFNPGDQLYLNSQLSLFGGGSYGAGFYSLEQYLLVGAPSTLGVTPSFTALNEDPGVSWVGVDITYAIVGTDLHILVDPGAANQGATVYGVLKTFPKLPWV